MHPKNSLKSKNLSQYPQKNKRQKLHRAYHSAADLLWKLQEKSGSLNSLMNRFSGDKTIKMIYALAVKVLKQRDIIEKIKNHLPEFDENTLNPYLIDILIGELLFGEKSFLKYRRKNEVKYVSDNQKTIEDYYHKIKNEIKQENTSKSPLIRYIRINYIKISKPDLVKKIKKLGFEEKAFQKENLSFDQFKKLALSLEKNEFMIDFHFEDLFLFHEESTKTITQSELYEEGLIAIQDKSSLLAIEAMKLEKGMKIMDACAAPGMKTSAIASRLQNDCVLYANDCDKRRFNDMKAILHRSGVKFKSLTQDFTRIDPSQYQDLDILLLDPSCSGSGINRRLEYSNKPSDEIDTKRCEKLSKFQLSILQSSLEFNAKKIIYCTCSKFQMENEDVINNFLELNPNINYSIVDPMPEWNYRGCGNYPFSALCLRADYDNTLTNGFFCCVLKRKDLMEDSIKIPKNQYEESEDQEIATKTEKSKKKRKSQRNSFSVTDF